MTKKVLSYYVIIDDLYEDPTILWKTCSKTRRGSIQSFDSLPIAPYAETIGIGETINCYKNLRRRGITKCVKFEVKFNNSTRDKE